MRKLALSIGLGMLVVGSIWSMIFLYQNNLLGTNLPQTTNSPAHDTAKEHISSSPELLGSRWRFVSYNRRSDAPRGIGYLTLNKQGEYRFAFCNTTTGTFTLEGEVIQAKSGSHTLAMCTGDGGKSMEMDTLFSRFLLQHPTAQVQGNNLLLTNAQGDQFIFEFEKK